VVDVIRIIRARWPEAALVILLLAGLLVLLDEVAGRAALAQQEASAQMGPGGFICGMGTAFFAIIWQMLYLGFLATACSEGTIPHEPGRLVGIGRLFFWRVLRFQILLGIVYTGISFTILVIVQSIVFGSEEGAKMPAWIVHLCSFAALAVLAKPMLLGPAVIIVRDRMVLESSGLLKEYRLLEARDLVWAFVACFGAVYVLSLLLGLIEIGSAFYYIMLGVYALVSSTCIVAVNLGAVLFIGSKTSLATKDNLTTD
jgi:hypothetical protein